MADDFEKGSEGAYPGNFLPSLHPYDAEHPSHRAMRQMRAEAQAVSHDPLAGAKRRIAEQLPWLKSYEADIVADVLVEAEIRPLVEVLEECAELFMDIRGDWTECRTGSAIIDDALARVRAPQTERPRDGG